VPGVGVGDDERTKVVRRRLGALLNRHAAALVLLVTVGGQQRPHQRRALGGHLVQRVTCQVGPRILGLRALGRGGPAAEVDPLDAQSLHGHDLPRRVRPEGRNAPSLLEQLAQPGVKGLGRFARHGVVVGDGAALLHHLARRVQPRGPREARAVKPPLRLADLLLEGPLGAVGILALARRHRCSSEIGARRCTYCNDRKSNVTPPRTRRTFSVRPPRDRPIWRMTVVRDRDGPRLPARQPSPGGDGFNQPRRARL
jgi:hypothetical protein